MSKPKTHRILTWGEIAEPYCNMVDHPEIMLTAIEYLVESSRPYRTPGRWGASGITGLLLDNHGAVNGHKYDWTAWGDWNQLMARCRKTIVTAMLTQHYDATTWRRHNKIGTYEKVRIKGPLGGDIAACRKAWERLCALQGKNIIPLNPCHRKATKLFFCGIRMHAPWQIPEKFDGETRPDWKPHRKWAIRFEVGLEGSSWELDFLCHDRSGQRNPRWFKPPAGIENFRWHRQRNETLTQWFNRTADFIETLLQPK